ncbi:MAG TPA: hypothetical protein VJL35_05170 [Gemmatimonadaceae bacterium]|nr:hypothetical protein [Gemmatimonadaceae bacterium]
MAPLPRIPWQATGNHWITIPCIQPGDASVHCVSALHAGLRGSIEFAGGDNFIDGESPPVFQIRIDHENKTRSLGEQGIAWERESGWLPSFSCRIDDLAVRGLICAPHGSSADIAGAVFEISIENRGGHTADINVSAVGANVARMLRIRSARPFDDPSLMIERNRTIVASGAGAGNPGAIAFAAANPDAGITCDADGWRITEMVSIPSGESRSVAFFIAVAQEPDGAESIVRVMRRRGAPGLIETTRAALLSIEPATGNNAADRLIARHMFFAYFCSVGRAVDDSHIYVVRSRIPWNSYGATVRDWEALMWVMPALQLADPAFAREVLLRICDLHGYAPGSGVHYLDGALFEPGFSLEGAAAYPVAVDEYIVQSGDDKIVEEPLLADALYSAFEDIESRRNKTFPLYATEINADGTSPLHSYTLQANTIAALALDVLSRTLDEKTAEKVQDPAAVRAAVLRQFVFTDAINKPVFTSSVDLNSPAAAHPSSPAAYWLPYFDLLDRDDSMYRRTVKPLESADTDLLLMWIGRLHGPDGARALDWLRRAALDGGLAAENVDESGRATANGGDAALSGLLAFTAWYAVNALGVRI